MCRSGSNRSLTRPHPSCLARDSRCRSHYSNIQARTRPHRAHSARRTFGRRRPRRPERFDAPSLLRQYPFVRFTRRTGVGRIIDATLRQRRISVQEAMELDSIEAILAMVSRGLGVAVVPEGPVRSAVLTGVRTIDFAENNPSSCRPRDERAGKRSRYEEMLFSELKSSASIS